MLLKQIGYAIGGQSILHAVDLTVKPGELLVLIGPNGCGKSTTLRLMAGLMRPDCGRILLDGRDMSVFSRRQLSQQVALLTQAGQMPSAMQVRDLVGMGRYAHQHLLARASQADMVAINRAMAAMDIENLADRRLSDLSGGQLQRCRMAMVLAQQSPIILLDEPTTYLDLRYQYSLLEKARDLARQGHAVVAVLHDFTQASLYADRIAMMDKGSIVAVGPPRDVLSQQNLLNVFGVRTRLLHDDHAVIHLPDDSI
ncbi:ABC transporter ATP-binding protein [Brucellaceae bacterium D45D]